MTWNYSKKTTDLFMAAVQGKPGTHLGEIEDADGFGEHGSIACGDDNGVAPRLPEGEPYQPSGRACGGCESIVPG